MMTQDDKKPVDRYTNPQQSLLNKYDEQNLLTNNDRLHDHPSRSFKYLQEMTGEQQQSPGIKKSCLLRFQQKFILF
jgi:hypothetical protein